MPYHLINRFLLIVLLIGGCSLSLAQTTTSADEAFLLKQQQIHNEIQQATDTIQRLKGKLKTAQGSYQKAQKSLLESQNKAGDNPTKQQLSLIKNQQFKLALAEHKRNKLGNQIAEQTSLQYELEQKLIANEKQQATDTARRQWLKKVAQEEKTKAAIITVNNDPVPATTAVNTNKQSSITLSQDSDKAKQDIPEVSENITLETLPSPKSTLNTTSRPNPTSNNDDSIQRLDNTADISSYRQLIDQRASSGNQQSSRNSRIMTITSVKKQLNTQANKTLRLTPMGNNIYNGVHPLSSGDTVFIIGFNRWRQTIPSTSYDNTDHIFVFDNSNPQSPKIVFYPKALESQP